MGRIEHMQQQVTDLGGRYEVIQEVRTHQNLLLMQIVRVWLPDWWGEKSRVYTWRQDSVVMIPIIQMRNEIYTIILEEFRGDSLKTVNCFPQGSMDHGGENPEDVALRETQEEMHIPEGVTITPISLGEVASASGGCEHFHYFIMRILCPDGMDISAFHEKTAGCPTEGEHIKTKAIPFHSLQEKDFYFIVDQLGLAKASNWVNENIPKNFTTLIYFVKSKVLQKIKKYFKISSF